jgi:hypothetical protein
VLNVGIDHLVAREKRVSCKWYFEYGRKCRMFKKQRNTFLLTTEIKSPILEALHFDDILTVV